MSTLSQFRLIVFFFTVVVIFLGNSNDALPYSVRDRLLLVPPINKAAIEYEYDFPPDTESEYEFSDERPTSSLSLNIIYSCASTIGVHLILT